MKFNMVSLIMLIFLMNPMRIMGLNDSNFLAVAGVSCAIGGVAFMAATHKPEDDLADTALRFCSGAISTGLICHAISKRTVASVAAAGLFGAVQYYGDFLHPRDEYTIGDRLFLGGLYVANIYVQRMLFRHIWFPATLRVYRWIGG